MNLLTSRRAIRTFENNHKIPRNVFKKILKDTSYAPSSFNLQPWHFFIIETLENKKKLAICLNNGNRSQLETSSAMILIFGDINKKELKTKIYNDLETSKKEIIFKKINNYYDSMTNEEIKNELFLECGIVSLQLMLSAKNYGYETCPIGGFNKKKINELFKIEKKYLPILIVAIGKKVTKDEETKNFKMETTDFTHWL
ncbi:nitroreductase [Candidatus Phytoplasma mali]|uniref:Nitroreductase n=1 Tax=Phytoplasma mali (strain AT) TaxID=482235 RepID=B3QZT6_PHYMT|nr:nitroreductase family protein [Candidatus Phytoplasma mali]AAA18506.1 This ORF is homologous to nitroreductase from Enterobacter cloacae, Accession Number A38686, and Salmonella, Accession Number P15888 [Phytoplasma sp.]CAP18473.1 nitroreductase [Candidatus Phytoplasma mali]